jgi:hypothetical protein
MLFHNLVNDGDLCCYKLSVVFDKSYDFWTTIGKESLSKYLHLADLYSSIRPLPLVDSVISVRLIIRNSCRLTV